MFAVYKTNLNRDTSVIRTYGSLESQELVYLTSSYKDVVEFFCDTDLITKQEAEDITLGSGNSIRDGDIIYFIEEVK